MTGKRFIQRVGKRWWLAVAVLWAASAGTPAMAQNAVRPAVGSGPPAPPAGGTVTTALAVGVPDVASASGVVQAGCSTCGNGLLAPTTTAETGDNGCCHCAEGCPSGCCHPGYYPCDCPCDSDGYASRLLGGIYHCICCPDPCYEPQWVPLANASFFTDGARPRTQMRLRADTVFDLSFPDKAEYFWGQEGIKGPGSPGAGGPPAPAIPGAPAAPGTPIGERRVNYRDYTLYTEGARGPLGVFVELNYRNVGPDTFDGGAGFGDMNLGTKTLLLDCELLQFAFQFKTFLPTGNFNKGLGTSHVSLEPAFLLALKLTPQTYLQAETALWFPVGGETGIEGPVFHYHLSLNQLLWCCGRDIQLIGTVEAIGYEIGGGAFTKIDGTLGSAKDIDDIFSIGPGLRLSICNKIDFGVGSAFSLTSDKMGADFIRAEFRWLF
jgi:hypothetical protein